VSIQIENAKKKEILFKEADAMRLSEHWLNSI
jgi:hypothetical protein